MDLEKAIGANESADLPRSLWRQIQARIGALCDGTPGKKTAQALAQWQATQGLTACDGVVCDETLQALGLLPDPPAAPKAETATPAKKATSKRKKKKA